MNKTNLVSVVAERSGMTKKDTERVINAAIDAITEALVRRETVQLSGFGTFAAKYRKERVGRNPRTREQTQVPAAWVPTFSASKALKENVDR